MAFSQHAALSIVVTAHNCDPFLKETLSSIKLACGDIFACQEIILINDSSTDRTQEIIDEFSSLHTNVESYQVNFRNIGKVRNFALSKCTGQFITMIDGDDQILPDSLKDIIPFLVKNKPDIFLSPLNELYEGQPNNYRWKGVDACQLTQDKVIKKFLIHRELQAHFTGQFFSHEIIKKFSFPEFICYEDAWVFPLLLKLSNSISYSTSGHYIYHKRKGSLSEQITSEKISLLIEATEQMNVNFERNYLSLISCHWINILHKYEKKIKNIEEMNKVKGAIQQVPLIRFLTDPLVRFSFKKKLIKLKLSGRV